MLVISLVCIRCNQSQFQFQSHSLSRIRFWPTFNNYRANLQFEIAEKGHQGVKPERKFSLLMLNSDRLVCVSSSASMHTLRNWSLTLGYQALEVLLTNTWNLSYATKSTKLFLQNVRFSLETYKGYTKLPPYMQRTKDNYHQRLSKTTNTMEINIVICTFYVYLYT